MGKEGYQPGAGEWKSRGKWERIRRSNEEFERLMRIKRQLRGERSHPLGRVVEGERVITSADVALKMAEVLGNTMDFLHAHPEVKKGVQKGALALMLGVGALSLPSCADWINDIVGPPPVEQPKPTPDDEEPQPTPEESPKESPTPEPSPTPKESPTPPPTPKPSPSPEPSPPPDACAVLSEKGSEFKHEVVEGVDLYYLDPLPTNWLQQEAKLFEELNCEKLKMEQNARYLTLFVKESAMKEYDETHEEKTVSVLKRMVEKGDAILKTAKPPLEGGVALRRIIVLGEDFPKIRGQQGPLRFINADGTEGGLLDTDGIWGYEESFDIEIAAGGGGSDGELHEALGHSASWLPDMYALGFEVAAGQSLPAPLKGVPEKWQQYPVIYRTDRGQPELMDGGHTDPPRISKPLALLLKRREVRGDAHDANRYRSDTGGIPLNEHPKSVNMSFFTPKGEKITPAKVEMFGMKGNSERDRATGSVYNKDMVETPVYSKEGEVTNINPFDLFINGHSIHEITLFVKVTDTLGNLYVIWMDGFDFVIPSWGAEVGEEWADRSFRERVEIRATAAPLTQTVIAPETGNPRIRFLTEVEVLDPTDVFVPGFITYHPVI